MNDVLEEIFGDRMERRLAEARSERLARALRAERRTIRMPIEEPMRALALKQAKRARTVKLRLAAFALAMVVLGPVWVVAEYLRAGGWPRHLSPHGNPGDWSPWLIWVALAWGFYVALSAVTVYFRRPVDEQELERHARRLESRLHAG